MIPEQAGAGADTVSGAAGNDRFIVQFSDMSADRFLGGVGVDSLLVSVETRDPDFDWIASDVGINLFKGTLLIDENTPDSIRSIENVETDRGNDTVVGSQSANLINVRVGANIVYARAGNDTILGGNLVPEGEQEILNGGAGNDLIYAGESHVQFETFYPTALSSQTVVGGDGNDTIEAGSSLGIISGGAGVDQFWFDDGFSTIGEQNMGTQATITDYEIGEVFWISSSDPVSMTFIGETDDELAFREIGYYRDGADTVLAANVADDAEYLRVRLTGYKGDISADVLKFDYRLSYNYDYDYG